MKHILFLVAIAFPPTIFAAKNLGAHVHGSVGLDIAVEGNQILVMFNGPSESFLGFEYKPKTKEEKKKLEDLKVSLDKNLLKIIGTQQLGNCSQKIEKIEQFFQGEKHSEIRLEAYIKCKTDVKGKSLEVKLSQYYPNIRNIHIQLIREDGSVLNEESEKEQTIIKL